MRTQEANNIPLISILDKLGYEVKRKRGDEWRYSSPLRHEKTPSFDLNVKNNVWFDHGAGVGGKVIDFVIEYLKGQNEDHTVRDALRWIENMHLMFPAVEIYKKKIAADAIPALTLKKIMPLKKEFAAYLKLRGIPLSIAKLHLKEAYIHNANSGLHFHALAIANENGGYEIRNRVFKGAVKSKAITFIRGTELMHTELHIFEGMMDFLSSLCIRNEKQFQGDVIILNSLSCMGQAYPYIKNYPYKTVHGWLDNDAFGKKATAALKEFVIKTCKMNFEEMNSQYSDHKDVNAWHQHKLGL